MYSLYGQDEWHVRPNLTLTLGLRYDVDAMPSAQHLSLNGAAPAPPITATSSRALALLIPCAAERPSFAAARVLFTGPFDYSDVLVSWMGASEFTYMNQPLLPQFSNPSKFLIGLGASGAVGVPGPVLLRAGVQQFHAQRNLSRSRHPAPCCNSRSAIHAKKFDNAFAEQASLRSGKSDRQGLVRFRRLPVHSRASTLPRLQQHQRHPQRHDSRRRPGVYARLIRVSGSRCSCAHRLLDLSTAAPSACARISRITTACWPITPIRSPSTSPPTFNSAIRRRIICAPVSIARAAIMTSVTASHSRSSRKLRQPGTSSPRDFKFSVLSTLQSSLAYTILAGFDVNGDIYPFSDRVGNIGRNTYRGDPNYDTDLRLQRVDSLHRAIQGRAQLRGVQRVQSRQRRGH